jgi:hypothetical protein
MLALHSHRGARRVKASRPQRVEYSRRSPAFVPQVKKILYTPLVARHARDARKVVRPLPSRSLAKAGLQQSTWPSSRKNCERSTFAQLTHCL